jgi:hypothetical protein
MSALLLSRLLVKAWMQAHRWSGIRQAVNATLQHLTSIAPFTLASSRFVTAPAAGSLVNPGWLGNAWSSDQEGFECLN